MQRRQQRLERTGQERLRIARIGRNDASLVLSTGAADTLVIDLQSHRRRDEPLPALECLLPAVAAAWAVGIAPELIAAGIKTFEPVAVLH